MKVSALIIFGIVLFCICTIVSADVIEPGTHYVSKCIKITNLSEYPNYVFLDYATLGEDEARFLKIVKQEDCLEKGYKYNQYTLKAIKSDSINVDEVQEKITAANYASIDLSKAINANVDLDPFGGYIGDLDPKSGENIDYKITQINSEGIFLAKVSQETVYNNGSPNKMEYFDENGDLNQPVHVIDPIKTPEPLPNIITSFICFFKSFFGMGC